MARWQSGAEQRLRQAALELFHEHGFDNVTVTQIAERAGLTRRSFFRYFADKREVLFAGSEQLPIAIAAAIRAVPPTVSPLAAVLDALADIGAQLVESVDGIAERRVVIDASPELRERERTKAAAITAAIREALAERQVDTAELLAQVATITFQDAFAQWVRQGGELPFAACLDKVTGTLRTAFTGLSKED